MSNLSTLDFKPAKSTLLAKVDVSTSAAVFKSAFVAWLDKSNSSFTFSSKDSGFGKYSVIYVMPFSSIQLLIYCILSIKQITYGFFSWLMF